MKVKEIDLETAPTSSEIQKWPEFGQSDYLRRIESLLQLASSRGFTHLVIYGDREHYSNLHFLTGYDPRFEEALLILSQNHDYILVVGNEGMAYSDISPVPLRKCLYQTFSLVGQPRSGSMDLISIFRSAGISGNSKIGLIGWKYATPTVTSNVGGCIDIPHYLVSCLEEMVENGKLRNATDLMLDPACGLRIRLDTKELVAQEIAGSRSSDCVRRVMEKLHPGLAELEASSYFQMDGEPLSAHPLINFGQRNVVMGLCSPFPNSRLQKGQVISIALGYRRAMCARTGLFVSCRKDIPLASEGIVEKFYVPYFAVLARWYESIRIGVTGGEVYQQVNEPASTLSDLGIALNPGHLIHTDEWTNSIFFEGSKYPIVSGMAIQCDIIAFPGMPFVGTHVEDGILVADRITRDDIRSNFPDCWDRIQKRKSFMKDILGIELSEEVLPVSNIQAMLHPYMGNLKIVLSKSI